MDIRCNETEHTSIEHCYAECHVAEYHNNLDVMLSVIILSGAELNDVAHAPWETQKMLSIFCSLL